MHSSSSDSTRNTRSKAKWIEQIDFVTRKNTLSFFFFSLLFFLSPGSSYYWLALVNGSPNEQHTVQHHQHHYHGARHWAAARMCPQSLVNVFVLRSRDRVRQPPQNMQLPPTLHRLRFIRTFSQCARCSCSVPLLTAHCRRIISLGPKVSFKERYYYYYQSTTR